MIVVYSKLCILFLNFGWYFMSKLKQLMRRDPYRNPDWQKNPDPSGYGFEKNHKAKCQKIEFYVYLSKQFYLTKGFLVFA